MTAQPDMEVVAPDHARWFAEALMAWQIKEGRHDLPWQTSDPYAIWVSEMMLQQTQVATVRPYYVRFMQLFPDWATLAAADLEAVLALWSGLGYYRRARLMHACAQAVVAQHGGVLPDDPALLLALPGIGRSTAAAVLALAWGRRAAILDGNVKRVLCRVFGVTGWPGHRAVEQVLWQRAVALLPAQAGQPMRTYTQGLMDLGAMLCTRSRPRCEACPMVERCQAKRQQRQADWPTPRPARSVPVRRAVLALMCEPDRTVWLECRPTRGIWGGLWSLPELHAPSPEPFDGGSLLLRQENLLAQIGRRTHNQAVLADVHHVFTHFRLHAHIWQLNLLPGPALPAAYRRVGPDDWAQAPLPQPIKILLRDWWRLA